MPAPQPPQSHTDLRLLGALITTSIDTILARFDDQSLWFPSLHDPDISESPAERLLGETQMIEAKNVIVAAAAQIVAMVRSPVQTVVEWSMVFHLPSCMRAAIESNMVEIVRDAGPQGIHVKEIAKKNNTDPTKAARILRLLANHHIFTELSPDVFCSNRLSSVLDSGKTVDELVESPHLRHVNTSGMSALILTHTDEAFKGSAYLTEAFLSPNTAHSTKAIDSPWNIAMKTEDFLFDWYDRPENAELKTRFSFAMACSGKLEPPEAILIGFDWAGLPTNSVVVDVGGGVGSTALILATKLPDLKVVIQDRCSVIEDAKTYWADKAPELVKDGRVQLQVHNFFDPQPITNADIFLLRWIMHDWTDTAAVDILRRLREAVAPGKTKLITVDIILPYTCYNEDQSVGAAAAPPPLLHNMGAASSMKYWLDFQMFVLGNSQERTLAHFSKLAESSGWKVVEVHHIPGSSLAQCVSVPV
ncbi:O-methyltransferase [Roridomyces roridus]|uniref:O-methyltransferase n=1 Tax=Roridomyces roridus TaxID=1738132 RepID=A0AAD7F8U5_9AGAR|nr:O-methyltransferase [Roridomyces roridus]